ncbi:MAG: 3-deoxy-7-phosphoheptulonate synthase [Gemmatimonadota bacterium]
MLVVMRHNAHADDIERVVGVIGEMGYGARPIPGGQRTAVGIIGNDGRVDSARLEGLPGVLEVIPVTHPYKQVSREWKEADTRVRLPNGTVVGGPEVWICAWFRFALATSPYSFQGLGVKGLEILAKAREATGLAIVTEALDPEGALAVAEHADIVQIGARNMQNYPLLRRAGRVGKPVLLKRGMSATIDELLLAAEYILAEGNDDVILCERGVRSFDNHTRNLLDLTAIPVVKALSHLPIIADPSHGTGLRSKVIPMARAAVAAGADGIMVEVHPDPPRAMSDGGQSLYPDQFSELMDQIRVIARAIGREITAPLGEAPLGEAALS